MGKFPRSFSKSVFFGLAMAGMILGSPRQANAQFGVTECWDPTDTPQIVGAIGSTTASVDEIVPELDSDTTIISGVLTGLLTKIDMDITALAGTNTNNATMNSALLGKQGDYTAEAAHVEGLQASQAEEQNRAASGAHAYQRNNICQQATLQAGRSSGLNGMLTELVSYNNYRAATKAPTMSNGTSYYSGVGGNSGNGNGPTCTTCGGGWNGNPSPAGVIGFEFMNSPVATKLVDLAKAATPFFGQAEGGADNATWNGNGTANQTGTQMVDNTTGTAHLDVDPLSLSGVTQVESTYTDTEQKAHDQLSNYLVGIPPDVVTSAKSFGSATNITPQYAAAIVASREKLAFENLTSEAMAVERAYHDGVDTGAQPSVDAIYKAANVTAPSFQLSNGTYLVSPASLDFAMYDAPADDPNFASNLSGQNDKTLLEFIADEMLLL